MTSDRELLEPLRQPRPGLRAFDPDEIVQRATVRRRKRRSAASAAAALIAAGTATAVSVLTPSGDPDLAPARPVTSAPVVRDCATLPQSDPMQARAGSPLPDDVLLQATDFSEPWSNHAHTVGPATPRPAMREASTSLGTSGWSFRQRVVEAGSIALAQAQFAAISARLVCEELGSPGIAASSAVVLSDTVRSGERVLVTRRTEHGGFEQGPGQEWSVLVLAGERISEVDLRSSSQLSPTSRVLEDGWVGHLAGLVADRLQGRRTSRLPPLRTVGAPTPGSSPTIDGSPQVDVSGTLVMVGGPPTSKGMTPRVAVSGTVIFLRQSDGARVSVAAVGGEFQTALPAGRYTVGGRSPKFNEGRTDCRATGTVVVAAHAAPVEVVCPRK